MADFMRDVELETLPEPVKQGIHLHRSVDAFTDSHLIVRGLRKFFSPARRRFSGVVLDVVFDHFLIRHWSKYSENNFDHFVENCYQDLWGHRDLMPERMEMVVSWMIKRDWIRSYAELSHVGRALDGLAGRLKMDHGFHGVIVEVEEHYPVIETGFLEFFPELCHHVESLNKH